MSRPVTERPWRPAGGRPPEATPQSSRWRPRACRRLRASTPSIVPPRSSASMVICLPANASSTKRAPHLRHALRALRDDDDLDDGQHEEDHGADDVIAADNERAERPDDLTRVGLEENKPRRRDVEGEAEESRQEQQRRECRDADGVRHVEGDQQNDHGGGQVGRDEEVQCPGRQGDDHQPDDQDHEGRECDVRPGKPTGARQAGRSECGGAGPRAGAYKEARQRGRPAIIDRDDVRPGYTRRSCVHGFGQSP